MNNLKSKKKRNPFTSIIVLFFAFIPFFIGVFFLSGNITGNVVGNINQVSLNWVGILLVVLGLAEVFFILRKNRNF